MMKTIYHALNPLNKFFGFFEFVWRNLLVKRFYPRMTKTLKYHIMLNRIVYWVFDLKVFEFENFRRISHALVRHGL